MGHQAQHIALGIGEAGHITDRSIGVAAVAQHHLSVLLQLLQQRRIGLVTAFPVGNGEGDPLAARISLQPGTAARLHLQLGRFAEEMQVLVAGEGAGQQAHFGEHLEPVANAQHPPPAFSEGLHLLQHGCKACNGAAAQVIAVAEAPFHAAAGQPRRKSVRAVIAPGDLAFPLRDRQPPKLAAPNDQRRIEQPALLQVLQQRRHRLVRFAASVVETLLHVVVRIPNLRFDVELHEPHAAFDQAPGHQTTLAVRLRRGLIQPVRLARRLRLLR